MAKKQKSGLYRTKITIGTKPDGAPIYKYISATTRAELEEERQKAVAYYIDANAPASDVLFGEYATKWYHTYKEPFVSRSSQNAYRTMLNRHLLPAFGDRNLRAITPDDVQSWLNGFARQSKSQIAMATAAVTGIFDKAVRDRILDRSPAQSARRPNAAPPEAAYDFSPDDRTRIEAVAATHPEGLYLALMYYTGMRPGEARGLQWGDIDFDGAMIHVQRDLDYAASGRGELGDVKTRAANRRVPLAARLRDLLLPVRGLPTANVITGDHSPWLSSNTAKRRWTRLMIECGLADEIPGKETAREIFQRYTTRCTPHDLRHNFITMCWESGLDVYMTMRIVGHTDITVTREIYTTLSARHLEQAKNEIDEMFGRKKSCTKVAQTARERGG